jgi:hypothetical protein
VLIPFLKQTANYVRFSVWCLSPGGAYPPAFTVVVYENFIPQKGPSTQLVDATSCVKMCDAMIGAEELSYIFKYQTLSADKN